MAFKSYRQSLQISRAVQDRRGEISVLLNIGQTQRAAGSYREARQTIEDSLKLIESLRGEASSSGLRASYFASVREHYELYVEILMQLGRIQPSAELTAEAFAISERARARSLL